MAKQNITNITTTGHQKNHLKLSLSGAPSPALPSPAIKGTIVDPANKTKPFEHLLMPELANTSHTSSKQRRKDVRWNKRCLFYGVMDFDWKNAKAIEDTEDTIFGMILQQRPGECGAPTAGILQQANAAYLEMEREAEEADEMIVDAGKEEEQTTTTEAESSDFGRSFSWSDLDKPRSQV